MATGDFAYGLDASQTHAKAVSIDEVANQIRKQKKWQILDASSRTKASGIPYFRFKLLRQDGKVKVIDIDPNNPNLRRLE